MVVHAFNPALGRPRQADLCELVSRASSTTAIVVTQNKKKKRKKEKRKGGKERRNLSLTCHVSILFELAKDINICR